MELTLGTRVSLVYDLESSDGPNTILKKKFVDVAKIKILQETVCANSIPEGPLDLVMWLGDLHYIPETDLAIKDVPNQSKLTATFYTICTTAKRTNLSTTGSYLKL